MSLNDQRATNTKKALRTRARKGREAGELPQSQPAKQTRTSPKQRRMIGEHLRQARRLRGMTQTKLAQLIGTSPSQISQIENEHAGTSMRSTMATAQALNVEVVSVFRTTG